MQCYVHFNFYTIIFVYHTMACKASKFGAPQMKSLLPFVVLCVQCGISLIVYEAGYEKYCKMFLRKEKATTLKKRMQELFKHSLNVCLLALETTCSIIFWLEWTLFHYDVIGGRQKWALIRICSNGNPNKLVWGEPKDVKQPNMTKRLCLRNLYPLESFVSHFAPNDVIICSSGLLEWQLNSSDSEIFCWVSEN